MEQGSTTICPNKMEVIEKNDATWQENETKLLLDKYEHFLPLVGPLKKFKTKKNMWVKISQDLEEILGVKRTSVQCENRFKTLMKRKKNADKKNRETGESPQQSDYDAEIDKITSLDDSLEPEVKLGVGHAEFKRKSNSESPSVTISIPSTSKGVKGAYSSESDSSTSLDSNPKAKRRKKTIQETLWDIHKDKEEQRNRRHQDKLNILNKLFGNTTKS